MMRLPVLEIGAGQVRDPDVDLTNDIQPFPGIDIVSDARNMTLLDRSCAVITSNHLIEHLDADGQLDLLGECYRLLANDGMLLLWTPDLAWMNRARNEGTISQEWYDTLREGKGDTTYDKHRRLLTQGVLADMLTATGFRPRSIMEIGGSIECIAFKIPDQGL